MFAICGAAAFAASNMLASFLTFYVADWESRIAFCTFLVPMLVIINLLFFHFCFLRHVTEATRNVSASLFHLERCSTSITNRPAEPIDGEGEVQVEERNLHQDTSTIPGGPASSSTSDAIIPFFPEVAGMVQLCNGLASGTMELAREWSQQQQQQQQGSLPSA